MLGMAFVMGLGMKRNAKCAAPKSIGYNQMYAALLASPKSDNFPFSLIAKIQRAFFVARRRSAPNSIFSSHY
jgi:hypothetical protein